MAFITQGEEMRQAKRRKHFASRYLQKHIGSDFDDFLTEEGVLEVCVSAAQAKVMTALASEIHTNEKQQARDSVCEAWNKLNAIYGAFGEEFSTL